MIEKAKPKFFHIRRQHVYLGIVSSVVFVLIAGVVGLSHITSIREIERAEECAQRFRALMYLSNGNLYMGNNYYGGDSDIVYFTEDNVEMGAYLTEGGELYIYNMGDLETKAESEATFVTITDEYIQLADTDVYDMRWIRPRLEYLKYREEDGKYKIFSVIVGSLDEISKPLDIPIVRSALWRPENDLWGHHNPNSELRSYVEDGVMTTRNNSTRLTCLHSEGEYPQTGSVG